ncbi:MAG: adenylosuccinate lyase, partial [Bdellovibrionales bacterium]|nr:adenylosuccinate lyase [Bdellovibrionales bacterium]
MIARYSRPEMEKIWHLENRFQQMLEVEQAVAETQAELGFIPPEAARDIRQKGKFSIERIDEIEKTTRHDVIAFVSAVAENVGENGRYVHYGMTSSDVLDTALSLQVRQAGQVLTASLDRLLTGLRRQMRAHGDSLCPGRTHGMHAEPTSFGMKMAGFVAEFMRHRCRLEQALGQMAVGKLSGAVGTYSTQPDAVEKGVCDRLGLQPETIATQVIPRDRHAELFFAIAMLGSGLERLAIELRHLQRTEVGEVIEGFTPGQKGSSAMPHKKNPISAENITGAARLLRSYLQAGLENVALWHE